MAGIYGSKEGTSPLETLTEQKTEENKVGRFTMEKGTQLYIYPSSIKNKTEKEIQKLSNKKLEGKINKENQKTKNKNKKW